MNNAQRIDLYLGAYIMQILSACTQCVCLCLLYLGAFIMQIDYANPSPVEYNNRVLGAQGKARCKKCFNGFRNGVAYNAQYRQSVHE